LANLLTGNAASSLGLAGDASVSIPLMRGSGRHIVTEPLTQAERNVVYAMWDFEHYKKTFAVRVARDYLAVLRRLDEVVNSRENYRSVISSARRSRGLAMRVGSKRSTWIRRRKANCGLGRDGLRRLSRIRIR
jgi:hypothetical protein